MATRLRKESGCVSPAATRQRIVRVQSGGPVPVLLRGQTRIPPPRSGQIGKKLLFTERPPGREVWPPVSTQNETSFFRKRQIQLSAASARSWWPRWKLDGSQMGAAMVRSCRPITNLERETIRPWGLDVPHELERDLAQPYALPRIAFSPQSRNHFKLNWTRASASFPEFFENAAEQRNGAATDGKPDMPPPPSTDDEVSP